MRKPFVGNIKKAAKDNDYFRKVLFTGAKGQLVLMSLRPGEAIGEEIHEVDQVIYVVDGEGKVVIEHEAQEFDKGDIVYVPAGTLHNVINSEDESMKLFTVYAPAQHPDRTVHRTKADAIAAEKVAAGALV
jgi:mannose-6-phosphate isomerase-like protein (cupin superfamily)